MAELFWTYQGSTRWACWAQRIETKPGITEYCKPMGYVECEIDETGFKGYRGHFHPLHLSHEQRVVGTLYVVRDNPNIDLLGCAKDEVEQLARQWFEDEE